MKMAKANLIILVAIFFGHCAKAQQLVYDNHVHIWEGDKSVQSYLAQLKSTGQTATRFGAILIAKRGEPLRTKAKNDELIALSKKYTQLLPICSVHPLDGDEAINELRRIGKLGVKVIKIHPHTQDFDVTDAKVKALCQEAGKLGIIVLMDNANIKPGDSENLFNLAINCSGTKFIFAHMGAFNFRFWNILNSIRTAEDFYKNNIYFDISATVVALADSPVEAEFVWTMRNAGIDHILLGSDYPQFSLKDNADALDKLDLRQEEKDNIRYNNARTLLFPESK
ncbi:amidohydrolase family protein [Mucilaginibacter sp. HD30]